jgi:ATP-binding cassette subfamily C protein EexD
MASDKTNSGNSELIEALSSCRGAFVAVGVFSLLINLLMLLPAIYMLQVYDRVMASRSLETLAMITLIILAMFAVMGVLQVLRSRVLVRVSVRLDRELTDRIFAAMLRSSLSEPGGNSAQAMADATTLRQFITGQGLLAFFDAPWIPLYLTVMFLFDFWLGVYGIGAVVVLAAIAVANEWASGPPLAQANRTDAEARRFATENIRNAEVVQAMGMEPGVRQRLNARQAAVLRHQAHASDRAGTFSNLSRTFRMTAQALAYGLGAWLAIQGKISAGAIVAGAILLGQALRPVDQLIGSWRQIGGAKAAYRRLDELLGRHPVMPDAMSLPEPTGNWRFEQVAAAPPGTTNPTIRGVNLQLSPGEIMAVIGPSASGKSTLARAGLGVWPLLAGSVRIDEADINQYNRDQLGPCIGYLPQDIELFEGTVAENIARFGALDSEAIVAAAALAGTDELIRHLPDGYETRIGPGGHMLSAGQRQRIALARAVYGRPRVVVLDEPNSNLDDAGEWALLQCLQSLREQGAAVLVITHRYPILTRVDKILVMQNGQVLAQGPRDELLPKLINTRGTGGEESQSGPEVGETVAGNQQSAGGGRG